MLIEDFSTRLKKGLKFRGMKQADLATLTGLNRGTINNYINGKYEAKQTNIYKIAKVLNVSEAWLMGYDVAMDDTLNIDATKNIDTDKFEIIGKITKILDNYDSNQLELFISLIDEISNCDAKQINQINVYIRFLKSQNN